MSEEWGPWIEHDGKMCPVELGVLVKIQNGDVHRNKHYKGRPGRYAQSWGWRRSGWFRRPKCWDESCSPILRYKLLKPSQGFQILERIASQPQERVEA